MDFKTESQLRAELAQVWGMLDAEREKVAQLACAPSKICKVPILETELAAAQATISQMREALDWAMGFADSAISDGFRELGGESISDETHQEAKRYWERETKTFDGHKQLLAVPANLDALHEARAQALERIAEMMGQETIDASVLLLEA